MISANEFRQLFEAYLDMHSINFTMKSYKYSIQWDDSHKKSLELKSKKKTYSLINEDLSDLQSELGDVLYNKVIEFFREPIVSNLKFNNQNSDLDLVHDRFSEINPSGKEFRLHEAETQINYVLFELAIQGEHGSTKKLLGLTFAKGWSIVSDEVLFKRCSEIVEEEVPVKKIVSLASSHVKVAAKKMLDAEEILHFKRIKELMGIRETHAAQKYKELHDKEYNISFKIGSCESKEKNAKTFDIKYKWAQEAKSLTKKLVALQEKNLVKKKKIKIEFSVEDVSNYKELQVTLTPLMVCSISMMVFEIMLGEDEERFVYVPFCSKFVKRKSK